MTDSPSQPIAQRAGNAKTHRQATPEELKKHEADRPKILKGIRENHAKTMQKVARMQNRILFNDKG